MNLIIYFIVNGYWERLLKVFYDPESRLCYSLRETDDE